jgi:hypothetical protein
MESIMKRLVAAAALLLASNLTAFADASVYVSRPDKNDADLQTATRTCDQQIGSVRDGTIPSVAYNKCMRRFGWFYQKTIRTPPERTWIDPETGELRYDTE